MKKRIVTSAITSLLILALFITGATSQEMPQHPTSNDAYFGTAVSRAGNQQNESNQNDE